MPDPHVTIPDEDPIIQYTVGGSPDDEFTFPFSFFALTDIKVYDDEDLIDPADYTVTGNAGTSGGFDGGTVTLDAPVTNTVITILRDVPIARTTDFPLSGPFNITALNTQLDQSFAILQQQERKIDARIAAPDTDDPDLDLTLPVAADRATKLLGFDADGEPVVTDMTLDEIEEGATLAEQWANKTNGAVAGGEYSAKAYALGGTGVTDTAGKGAAKEWAVKTGSTVDGTDYSAKKHAQDAATSAGTATTQAGIATTKAGEATVSAAAALVSELAAAAAAASGMYDNTQDKSGNYTVVAGDEGDLIRVNSSGASRTITLTAISTLGDFKVAIAKITGDANAVTIQGSGGDTINGAASYTLSTQYANVTLISETGSTDWFAVGGGASASSFSNPDVFSGTGAQTAFTLSRDPGTENNLLVAISGVVQARGTYSVSGTTLTFSTAPALGTNNIEVVYLGGVALDIGVPSDGSVTTAKIPDDQVTNAKLAEMAANTVKVNATAASANPTDLALAASQILGRGSSGNMAAIGLDTSLEMNSTTLSVASKVLDRVVTTSDVSNSTSETAVYSFSVPGNTLATNRALRLVLCGDYLNNSGGGSNLTVNVKYGATTIASCNLGSITANANRRALSIDCVLLAANATNAQVARTNVVLGSAGASTGSGAGAAPQVTHEAVHNAIAEDSTAAKTLQVTITHGTLGATISGRSLAVFLEKI